RLSAGTGLVLPPPTGAAVWPASRAAATSTACLRNARAVAERARQSGARTFAVIPAGERWPDGSLRPAVEDWIGAGAVLAHLPGRRSPEADMAIAAFERIAGRVLDVLEGSSSGKELIARGFVEDVALAADLDVSTLGPKLQDGAFLARISGQQTASR